MLGNTQRDVIGYLRALIVLGAWSDIGELRFPLDASLRRYLDSRREPLESALTEFGALAGFSGEYELSELRSSLDDILSDGSPFYDRDTVAAYLALYGREPELRRVPFDDPEKVHAALVQCLSRVVEKLVDAVLWSRVDAHDNDRILERPRLGAALASAVALVVARPEFEPLDRTSRACRAWVQSGAVETGLDRTADARNGLTITLGELKAGG